MTHLPAYTLPWQSYSLLSKYTKMPTTTYTNTKPIPPFPLSNPHHHLHGPNPTTHTPTYHKQYTLMLSQQTHSSPAFPSPSPSPSTWTIPRVYHGPVLADPSQILAILSLPELGLDLAVAPSTIAPTSLGLYVILSEEVEQASIPAMTLLCGYSRDGAWKREDEGDKTVGFAMTSAETAVFYERKLMSVEQALDRVDEEQRKTKREAVVERCGLLGHIIDRKENIATKKDTNAPLNIDINVDVDRKADADVDTGADGNRRGNNLLRRYFVPEPLSLDYDESHYNDLTSRLSIQNLGQFANDLAWNYADPPTTEQEYEHRSKDHNAIQLVWRLEYDSQQNCLVPTWPVSTLAYDTTFVNKDVFMEIGTKYGWKYWQASVQLNQL